MINTNPKYNRTFSAICPEFSGYTRNPCSISWIISGSPSTVVLTIDRRDASASGIIAGKPWKIEGKTRISATGIYWGTFLSLM
jgi:hypothetical protein